MRFLFAVLSVFLVFENPMTKVSEQYPDDIVINFTGDVSFATYVNSYVKKHGIDYPFENVKEIFHADDLTVINFESAITDRKIPENPKKEYNFRSSSKTPKALKNASVEVVSLANNHSMDFGREGFSDTLKLLEKEGISRLGGGKNKDDAKKPYVFEKNGIKIGFLNYSKVVPSTSWYALPNRAGILGAYDGQLPEVLKAVKEARTQVDFLVVAIHWGKNPSEKVRKEEIKTGHALVDSGADLVLGHHPHCLQGAEFYNGGAIFYSLGNFIFPNMGGNCDKTAILQLVIDADGNSSYKFIPAVIKNCRPELLEREEKQRELRRINSLCATFGTKVGNDGLLY